MTEIDGLLLREGVHRLFNFIGIQFFMIKDRMDIKGITYEKLRKIIEKEGFPGYRTQQIFHWIYHKNVDSFREMKNIPGSVIQYLDTHFCLPQMECLKRQISQDGSEKFLYRLADNQLIESVFIRNHGRNTLCLSSQVGCAWHCLFCASGKDGLKRNLEAGEIIDQILSVRKQTNEKIHNIVFMGMGEPLNNYQNVMTSIQTINAREGLNIGARKITISTCGIIPGIQKLTENSLQIELSVSLHSADEKVRMSLMPVNRQYPLKELIEACRQYVKKKNRQITFEYLMLKGMNDSVEQADKLCHLIADFDTKVNLIRYNFIQNQINLSPSDEQSVSLFMKRLRRCQIPVTIRYSSGKDIHAACGQLKSHFLDYQG